MNICPRAGNTQIGVKIMKKAQKHKKNPPDSHKKPGEKLASEFASPVPTDILGSYTGNAVNKFDLPQQDADDL